MESNNHPTRLMTPDTQNDGKKTEDCASNDPTSSPTMSKSQRKRIRRGCKRKRTGKRNTEHEAILLSNLSPYCTVQILEEKLKHYADLTKDNSVYYIEILTNPTKTEKEAVIKFMDRRHTMLAFEKLQTQVVLAYPLVVTFQNSFKPGYKLDDGFNLRYEEHIKKFKKQTDEKETNNKPEQNEDARSTSDIDKECINRESSNTENSSSWNVAEVDKKNAQHDNSLNSVKENNLEEFALRLPCKTEEIDNHDSSNDSINTVVLERIEKQIHDFDDKIKLEPTSESDNDYLRIKEEPMDYEDAAEKGISKDLESNHIITDIFKIFNNIDPSEIDMKREPLEFQEDEMEPTYTQDDDADIEIVNFFEDIDVSAPSSNSSKTNLSNETSIIIRTLNDIRNHTTPSESPTDVHKNNETLSAEHSETNINENASNDHTTLFNSNSKGGERNHINTSEASAHNSSSTEIDESDANHCRTVHVKKLPLTTYTHLEQLIRNEMLTKMYKNINDVKYELVILYDEIDDNLLGEALLRLPTHVEASRACEVLNGAKIANRVIQVNLDIGHKILERHTKLASNRICNQKLQRKRKRTNTVTEDESTPNKQPKIEPELLSSYFKRKFLPPKKKKDSDYGLKQEVLKKFGLKPPLSNAIIVKELHQLVDEDKLYEVFSLAGEVRNIQFSEEQRKAKIEYDHPIEAVQAIYMFHHRKLFEKPFVIEMFDSPARRHLPLGLSGVNKALGRKGEPMRGVRSFVQLRKIQEILYESGKLNKFESKYFPFQGLYHKRDNIDGCVKVCHNPNSTDLSVDNSNVFNSEIPTIVESNTDKGFSQNSNQLDHQLQAIEALGAILIARGLIPASTDCKDARNILAALQAGPNNQHITNSNIRPPKLLNISNVPPSFVHNNIPNAMVMANPAVVAMESHPSIPLSKPTGMPCHDNGNTHNVPNTMVMTNPAVVPMESHPSIPLSKPTGMPCHHNGNTHNVPNTMVMTNPAVVPKNSLPSIQLSKFLRIPCRRNKWKNVNAHKVPNTMVTTNPAVIPSLPPVQLSNLTGMAIHHDGNTRWSPRDAHDRSEDDTRNPRNEQFADKGPSKPSTNKLIFRNLPAHVTQSVLTAKLNEVGALLYCKVMRAGLALVHFRSTEDANRCQRLFHRSKVDGQVIEVIRVFR